MVLQSWSPRQCRPRATRIPQGKYPPVIKHGNEKCPKLEGFNEKICYKLVIFHCHVWGYKFHIWPLPFLTPSFGHQALQPTSCEQKTSQKTLRDADLVVHKNNQTGKGKIWKNDRKFWWTSHTNIYRRLGAISINFQQGQANGIYCFKFQLWVATFAEVVADLSGSARIFTESAWPLDIAEESQKSPMDIQKEWECPTLAIKKLSEATLRTNLARTAFSPHARWNRCATPLCKMKSALWYTNPQEYAV